jgi:segregation and condensation protein B
LESPPPEEETARPLGHDEVRGAVEAVLYAASEPLSPRDLRKILPEVGTEEIKQCLQELLELYYGEGRGLQIVEVAGGYQITTRPEFHERVSTLFHFKPPSKISIQALETLATIAYRQPITVPEIQELRGVRSTSVIRTLLEKKLIRITGRKAVVGRPLLYGTTKEFLLRFGLKDLGELPSLEDMAEVFGEDMALQLDEFGGVGGPSPAEEGDEYPSGIISSDLPTDASNGDALPNEAESEKSADLPFNGDSEPSNGSSREQDS